MYSKKFKEFKTLLFQSNLQSVLNNILVNIIHFILESNMLQKYNHCIFLRIATTVERTQPVSIHTMSGMHFRRTYIRDMVWYAVFILNYLFLSLSVTLKSSDRLQCDQILRSGARDGHASPGAIFFFMFMQFLETFLPNNRLAHLPMGLASRLENPGPPSVSL